MNKELIDRVWKILPAEFKEAMKKIYGNSVWVTDWDQGYKDAMENLFGIHNLTLLRGDGSDEIDVPKDSFSDLTWESEPVEIQIKRKNNGN